MHLLIHLFTQQIVIEYQLCDRHYADKTDKVPTLGACNSGERGRTKIIKSIAK